MLSHDGDGRRVLLFGSWATTVVLASVLVSRGAPPAPASGRQLSFQARLTDAQGQPLSTLLAFVEFRVYAAPSGPGGPLWTEPQANLPVVNGIVSAILGQSVPLDPSLFDPVSGADRYVAVVVSGRELTRVKLTASAFALSASVAASLWDPANPGAPQDLGALDLRYVRTQGGGGVLRAVNGIDPDAAGGFSIAGAPGGNVSVLPGANGIFLSVGGVVRDVNGISPDAGGTFTLSSGPGGEVTLTPTANGLEVDLGTPLVSSLNGLAGGVSLVAGSGVTVAPSASGTITVSATGDLTEAEADSRYLNVGGDSMVDLVVFAGPSPFSSLSVNGAPGKNAASFNGSVNVVGNLAVQGGGASVEGTFSAGHVNAGLDVNVGRNLFVFGTVSANVKQFVVDHPLLPGKVLVYACLEGPEIALYSRSTATLSGGRATIALEDHFGLLADPASLTVHLTPGGDCRGLYVESATTAQVVVRECGGGTSDVAFSYLVIAKRLGHEDFQVVRDRPQ